MPHKKTKLLSSILGPFYLQNFFRIDWKKEKRLSISTFVLYKRLGQWSSTGGFCRPSPGTFDNLENILSCQNFGGGGRCSWHPEGKTRIAAKCSAMLGTALPTRNELASNVSIAEFGKPSSMQNYPIFFPLKWKKNIN